ncbi:MAG TPA: ABC transporter permease [Streptosporangiaceae bacterium]|nr:ABC transporter permease [Streptosporangiaceae bacterium]
MAFGIGTVTAGDLAAPEPTGPPAISRRARAIRLPRSGKIRLGLGLLAFFLLLAIAGPFFAPDNPSATFANAPVPLPPSAAHLLGTTQLQQDVLSQLLVSGRSTLLVAILAGAIATALSVLIGVTAGYIGGLADDLLSMLANIFLVMPALPLLIILTGLLGRSLSGNDFVISLIIAVTGWAWGARVLRAQTLSLRNRDYVDSARLIGERSWRIIVSEILPNLIPIVASSFLFTVLYAVGTYTALAFLGLFNPSSWSWGSMLFNAQLANAETSGYWWWFVPPGLAVALLGTSLALLNFGIDEFINPRLRAAGLTRSRRGARRQPAARQQRLMRGRRPFALTPVVRGEGSQP